METSRKILIIDDEESVRYSFRKLFRAPEYIVLDAPNGNQGLSILEQEHPDLVVVDIEMPGMSGLEVIQRIKKISPDIPVLIITAFGTTERVIDAMKYGAYEYLEKPFDIERLRSVVEEALSMTGLQRGEIVIGNAANSPETAEKIVGNSPAIKEVYKMIGRVATSNVSVLLVGESGTGKELVARAIHQYSNRSDKPFITINCAAIPDALLESELFGFEKGSFTDAKSAREGKFEAADGGTIFLDEIGDMSLNLQAKLLRVLQEGTFERIGSTRPVHVDARVIAATNKNLENSILTKEFREDLYYRLKVITITMPPLRMRKDDIGLLTHYFLNKHAQLLHKPRVTLPPESMEKLNQYDWPGNVRELENMMKRLILLSKSHFITPDQVDQEIHDAGPGTLPLYPGAGPQYIPADLEKFKGELYRHVIEEVEKDLIVRALKLMKGNQVKTARLLGISRVMLHERIEKYGIQPEISIRNNGM